MDSTGRIRHMTELQLATPVLVPYREETKLKDKFAKIGELALGLSDRPYTEEDYAIAHGWWTEYGRGHLEHFMLSPLGCVIEQDGKPLAMGWIYLTNSFFAQLGWVVTNPKIGPKIKAAALVRLFIMGEELIKHHGFKAIQMLSDQPVLTKLAMACGWTKMVQHDFLVRSLVEDKDDDI